MATCLQQHFNTISKAFIYVALCVILFFIGFIKGIFVGVATTVVVFVGHISVTIILWPIHIFMTYKTITRTKKLGLVAKLLSLILLPIPLFLWPIFIVVGTTLIGLGYGFGAPLVATFEDVGKNINTKIYHTFVSGISSTLIGACTIVHDFTNLCVHSYLDYLDDFCISKPKDDKVYDIKLLELPACLVVAVLGLLADTPLISILALVKSPILLFKGWGKLLYDLIGRRGACLDAECIPFGILAIILWPIITIVTILLAIISSPVLGLFGAVIAYQEDSLRCGLAYIVSIVSMFDEYTNDMLNLNEGSYLPRPNYRKDASKSDAMPFSYCGSPNHAMVNPTTIPQLSASSSIKQQLQEVNIIKIWEDMFRNINIKGKYLVDVGVLKSSDLDGWLTKRTDPKWKIVACGLPAYSTFHTLLQSAKANSMGILLSDGTELTSFNRPRDCMLEWFFEPLLTIKEELQHSIPTEGEEHYLEKLVLTVGDSIQMLEWENGAIEPSDEIRNGYLKALSRRLHGIATSISRLPTYRRHYQQFIKNLLFYASNKPNSNGSSCVSS